MFQVVRILKKDAHEMRKVVLLKLPADLWHKIHNSFIRSAEVLTPALEILSRGQKKLKTKVTYDTFTNAAPQFL